MNALTIYEERSVPKVRKDQRWMKLIISDNATSSDSAAVELFKQLAEVLALSEPVDADSFVLVLGRAGDNEIKSPDDLPQIRDGLVWKGIDQVESLVTDYIQDARKSLII